jgi:hypothetical protein
LYGFPQFEARALRFSKHLNYNLKLYLFMSIESDD